jgi:signal peptidase I
MFSIFASKAGKTRKIAKQLLEFSEKVDLYRRDVIPPADLAEQLERAAELRAKLKEKPFQLVEVETAMDRLHGVMCRNGGMIYPVSAGTDYTDMIIMAAIVAGGIRSFFLQPFQIPTNSMWPTYNGMTSAVRQPEDPAPTFGAQAIRRLTDIFATTHVVVSEASGPVGIPVDYRRYADGSFHVSLSPKKSVPDNGILGTGIRRGVTDIYHLYIGGHRQEVAMPGDFGFEGVLLRTYFPEEASLPLRRQDADRWQAVFRKAIADGRIKQTSEGAVLLTGRTASLGKTLLNFDILSGDMLFVDRVSYNFVAPRRGDTFVFRTNNIPGLNDRFGNPSQNYYVKRLVGVPGERLLVNAEGQLLVNGVAVAAPEPIAANNRRDIAAGYYGYLPEVGGDRYAIPLNAEHTVRDHHYYAMGDNSANSFDSRGWGEVPEGDVVGQPLFILHPFTQRWGWAK